MIGRKFLEKGNVQELIESLRKKYEVLYPVRKAGTKWHTFSNKGTAELGYQLTINPPKKVFFPPCEKMFDILDGKLIESEETGKPILLFGVHAHDLAAILVLDKAYCNETEDSYYFRRRKGSAIVALRTGEGPDSFQADFGKDWASLGGWDVLLEKGDGWYIATAGTKAGEEMISEGKFFSDEKNAGAKKTRPAKMAPLDLEKIAKSIVPENPIWKDIEGRCFGCGICSYVCPVCHCFEVEDRLSVSRGINGKRQRRWDSCTLPDFARVAGGHNFRPTLANRIFYWYHHKFVRAPIERGTVDCTGCGRCITFCPAKINLRDELGRLQSQG